MPIGPMLLSATLVCAPALVQWRDYPTPGIPQLPDGKPVLNGPAPYTADGAASPRPFDHAASPVLLEIAMIRESTNGD